MSAKFSRGWALAYGPISVILNHVDTERPSFWPLQLLSHTICISVAVPEARQGQSPHPGLQQFHFLLHNFKNHTHSTMKTLPSYVAILGLTIPCPKEDQPLGQTSMNTGMASFLGS